MLTSSSIIKGSNHYCEDKGGGCQSRLFYFPLMKVKHMLFHGRRVCISKCGKRRGEKWWYWSVIACRKRERERYVKYEIRGKSGMEKSQEDSRQQLYNIIIKWLNQHTVLYLSTSSESNLSSNLSSAPSINLPGCRLVRGRGPSWMVIQTLHTSNAGGGDI